MALGGNLGDTLRIFRSALAELDELIGPLRVAPVYRTEPVSPIPQPDFLNTVAVGRSSLPPGRLLAALHAIERRHGRDRAADPRVGAPRALDLDLLYLGDLRRSTPPPVLPHPRLRERRFVLAPLADLEPERALPPDGATVRALLATLPDRPLVRRERATLRFARSTRREPAKGGRGRRA